MSQAKAKPPLLHWVC